MRAEPSWIPRPRFIPTLLSGVKVQHRLLIPPTLHIEALPGCPREAWLIERYTKKGQPYQSCTVQRPMGLWQGQSVWIKERFAVLAAEDLVDGSPNVIFARSRFAPELEEVGVDRFNLRREVPRGFWRSAAVMPHAYSRLRLQNLQWRVERLHTMTEADAVAEGIRFDGSWWQGGWHRVRAKGNCVFPTALMAYEHLWDSIHGQGSWASDPWVWRLDFTPFALWPIADRNHPYRRVELTHVA